MIEHPGQQRLFVAKLNEVRGFPGRLDVSGALVLAVDRFVMQERLEERHRRQRKIEQLSGAGFAVACHERRRIELEARENLSAVSRAGSPAGALALEHDDRRARTGQLPRGREPCVAGADDGDVKTRSRFKVQGSGFRVLGSGFEVPRARNCIPPIRIAIQRRYCFMPLGPITST